MKKLLTLALFAACSTFSINASAKDARCKVVLQGEVKFNGACAFKTLGKDGSFVISRRNPNDLILWDVKEFWVRMEQKNVAELASVEPDNHFHRWGVTLIRSTRDRACWENERGDIQICAY
jgi:hypothetical protein